LLIKPGCLNHRQGAELESAAEATDRVLEAAVVVWGRRRCRRVPRANRSMAEWYKTIGKP